MGKNEKIQCMSIQAGLSGGTSQRVIESEDILQKTDLSGIDKWDPKMQQEAQDLICKYACIFSQNDLDLGKTSIVKHSIKLPDTMPFKEGYRCIPLRMYDEAKNHIKEMLGVGAIRPSNSPWASVVVLVQKTDEKLRFCIDIRKLNARTIKDGTVSL